MRQRANEDIRKHAKDAGVYLWQVADRLGMLSNTRLSEKLRYELPADEKAQIIGIIDALSQEV